MPKSKRKKNAAPPRGAVAMARQINDRAIDTMLAILFTALLDTFGKDADMLQAVWKQCEKLAEEISDGVINVKEMARVLRVEYGINITGGFKK